MLQLLRGRAYLAALFVLSFITFSILLPPTQYLSNIHPSKEQSQISLKKPRVDQKLHILLPTTIGDVNLCKTMLSARAMGYPEPVILGWGDKFDTWYLLGGGSHVAKISKVLEWLESKGPESDNDLVMMMDAFDIWFQLPPETLIERYHSINERANRRISKHMGKAAELEGIKQTVIFGAGKRCAPNQLHTLACYTVPMSPVPDDIYGANTDTVIGRNKYTSSRQRFLNSGYIIGPVSDMRKMFRKAWSKVQKWPNPDPADNGSGSSGFMYHGSDQSVFAAMFGEQEFQREVMRRRHASTWTKQYQKSFRKTPVSKIEGVEVPDILNPPFTHQTMKHLPGRPCEFGMGMDYFSDLGHQTANAETDAMWLRYDDDFDTLVNKTRKDRNEFDCPYRGDGKIPADMKIYDPATFLPRQRQWEQINLYTNLCTGTIPVMAHFNGDKMARQRQWPQFWVQEYGHWLVNNTESFGGGRLGATIFKKNKTDDFIPWSELCPSNYSQELYRGDDSAIVG